MAVPVTCNETARMPTYADGTPERRRLDGELKKLREGGPADVPLMAGGRQTRAGRTVVIRCPHDLSWELARVHLAGPADLKAAIRAALRAKDSWAEMEWDHRAAIFMRAADILEGPARAKNMAVIMACHSKTPYEAELDLEEMADFWRLGARYLQFIFDQQPDQAPGELNRLDWRPLEGFVLAVTPFNFYSIGGNLASAPAMAGNVVLWKPSTAVGLSGLAVMEVLEQAGLPAGVINFVPFASRDADLVLGHRDLAGVHFTGSFETLAGISKTVWTAPEQYRSIPRIVGETGGKGFLVAHASADPRAVATAIIRGGFEYQGQKCSALSRAYIPKSLWPQICGILREELPRLSFGDVARSHNFMGALISEEAFGKVTGYIELAKASGDEMVYDGGRHPGKGWFVGPTVIKVTDPHSRLMQEEIFGPVVTVFVYQDGDFKQTLALVDRTSPFALTGSVFARDRGAIRTAETALRFSAGNFYINDKPTGAVVGRQPFGGARHSGTNDKAGYWTNLLRWLSPRAIKETTAPLEGWRRPYMMK